MEERLLQCYLKYMKDRPKSYMIEDYLKILMIPILLWLFALLLTVPSLAFSTTRPTISLLCFAFQYFFVCLMSVYCNRFNIRNSVASFENYRLHCEDLARWLRSECNVDPVSEIVQEMIPKIECMAEEKTTEIERMKSRTEKFLYAVLLPIVLLILTELVREKDVMEIFGVSFGVLTVFFMIYVVIQGVANIKGNELHRQKEQYKHFADDLRAIGVFSCLEKREV